MNIKELAWAAGFFDGEGSTSVSGNGIHMNITQYDKEVLARFRCAVNVGKVYGPYRRAGERSKEQFWQFSIGSWRNRQVVYSLLWKFLGTKKRDQIIKAITTYRLRVPGWGLTNGKFQKLHRKGMHN